MFLDILLGTFWAFLTSVGFGVPLTPLWVLAGIIFAMLPDMDFWIEYLRRGKVGGKILGEHRVLTHIPLLFVIPAILLFIYADPAWGTLFILGVYGHFIHDATGMGYGYRIFYPFSPYFYKFLSDRDGNIRYTKEHFMVRWTEAEVQALHLAHGNDHWLQDDINYHRNHPWKLLRELTILLIIIFTFYFLTH
ncbi:MAG: metal-dependent hydrolase [Patescibacteria group bacterium]